MVKGIWARDLMVLHSYGCQATEEAIRRRVSDEIELDMRKVGRVGGASAIVSVIENNGQLRIHDEARVQSQLEKFHHHISEAQKFFKKQRLMERIEPYMYSLTGYQLFYIALKGKVQEYLLNNPEDEEIHKKWLDFRLAFSSLVHKQDLRLENCLQEFFNEIQEKLSLYSVEGEQISSDLSEIFRVLCSDPDLWDLSLGYLLKCGDSLDKGKKREVRNALVDLQKGYYVMVRECQELLVWFVTRVEEKVLCHEDLLKHLKSTATGFFYEPSLPSSSDDPANAYGQIQKALGYLKEIQPLFDRVQLDSVQSILEVLPYLEEIEKGFSRFTDEGMISDSTHGNILVDDIHLGMDMVLADPLWGGEERDRLLSLLEEIHQCYRMIGPYIHGFWRKVRFFYRSFQHWSKDIKPKLTGKPAGSYEKILRSIPRVIQSAQRILAPIPSITPTSSSSSVVPRPIDELLAYIEGSTPPAKKTTGRRSGRRPLKKAPPTKSKPKQKDVLSSSVQAPIVGTSSQVIGASSEVIESAAPASSNVVLSREERLLQTLLQRIPLQPRDQTSYLRSSLRQFESACNGLVTFYEKVSQIPVEGFKSYHYHEMISLMYYSLEQALRYKNIERDPSSGSLSHHVLEWLQNLGLRNHPKAAIVRQLYSANLWVSYTDQQIFSYELVNMMNQSQEKIRIPPILSHLQRISRQPSTQLRGELKNELKVLYAQTLDFLEMLMSPEDASFVASPSKACSKILASEVFNVLTIRDLQQNLRVFIDANQSLWTHEKRLNFQQAQKGLSFLKRTIKELTELYGTRLTLEQFSLHVKKAIHLTNHVCETLLKTVVVQRQYEHNLESLVDKISDFPKVDRDFFNQDFTQVHNDSRYPFDLGKIRSSLHQLILEAEFLREQVQLEEGFQFPKQPISTKMNFIPLPKKGFTSDEIWKETSLILSKALHLVFEVVVS